MEAAEAWEAAKVKILSASSLDHSPCEDVPIQCNQAAKKAARQAAAGREAVEVETLLRAPLC